ncbi:MAG: glycosyltransferase family 4 protein [Microbacterium sp.]
MPSLARKSSVVLNGVQPPPLTTPLRVEPEQLRLLFVGRLSPRKGPDLVIDALATVRRGGLDCRLQLLGSVFTGYEWYEAALREQVASYGLEDHVDFLGFRTDVWPVIDDADIVLVPSRVDEPFGNTAVEAVLAERPVIVSDTSGLREAVAGYASARLVEPGDSVAIAEALVRLVADWEEVRTTTETSAAAARERHSPERYRERVAAIVRDLAR